MGEFKKTSVINARPTNSEFIETIDY